MTADEKVRVEVGKLSKQGRALVEMAVLVGWYARNTVGGGVLLTAPGRNRSQRISVPASGISGHRLSGWVDKVARYADPVQLAAYRMKVDEVRSADTGQLVEIKLDPDGPLMAAFEGIDVGDDALLSRAEPESRKASRKAPREPRPEPERVVVSEQPWLARQNLAGGEGKFYESATTIERKWSDGSVDYRCSIKDCDYCDPLPNPVANHYRGSSKETHPPVERPGEFMRGEAWEPKHRTQSERAARLAAQIAKALENMGKPLAEYDGFTEVAAALADRLVEERDARRPIEDEQHGPLTAEQILERVRSLVDGGQYLARLTELRAVQQQVDELRHEVETCRHRAEEAENHEAAVQAEWDALVAIVQSKRNEPGGD